MTPESTHDPQVPLCVDLDGTLIKTDLVWESLALLLRRNPFWLVPVLFWWMRGRAFLKKKLAARVRVDAATLPYNESFLQFLRETKRQGRPLILATASDRRMTEPVFRHVEVFDELLASDGKTNLRGAAKLQKLTERFGERGFDYAGNSSVDLAVWAGAREAIVVNARRGLVDEAAKRTKVGPTFLGGYSPFSLLWRILYLLFVESRYLHAVIGGLLLAAAFPKIGVAGLAWVAPAFILGAAYGKRGGDAFRIGYVAGLAASLASLYWLLLIPVAGYPILGWIALSAYLALYPGFWVWLLTHTVTTTGPWIRRTGMAMLGAAAWVALDMVRARLLGGFPWNFIGASQFQLTPLIQIASVTGVYGVSFLVVWTSLSLYSAALAVLRKPTARYDWLIEILLPLVVILGLFFYGMARLRGARTDGPSIRITMVQPSIPQTMIWDQVRDERRFRELLRTSQLALTNHPDLLLWPESAVPDMIRYNEDMLRAITELARTNHVWIILVSDDAEPARDPKSPDQTDYFNASFLITPSGQLAARYCKRNLVMFGEYIPLVRWLPFVKWFTPIDSGYTPGDKSVPFELADLHVKTATLICFEDTFPQLARQDVSDDTDFLVNLTSDAWFGEGAEQWQHAVNAVFRTVENGVPLVRCCNNGLTCWVDSCGRIRQILHDQRRSIYGPGTMTVSVPILAPGERRPPTFYNRHGDWFGWGCVVVTILSAPFFFHRRKDRAPE